MLHVRALLKTQILFSRPPRIWPENPWICVQRESGNISPKGASGLILMQNVLFKTSEPTNAEGMVEFYAVSLSLQDIAGEVSVVQEIHGWWDNQTLEITIDKGSGGEPETFQSFSEAVDRYCALRIDRARTGYVHAFTWHCFTGMPSNYKRIELPESLSSRGTAK